MPVKKKLARGYAQICGDLRRFLRFCEELTRSVDISRPAPANSLALIYSANLKKHIDRIDYALYNIVMKLRNIQAKVSAWHSKWYLTTKSGKWWQKQNAMDRFMYKFIMFYALVLIPLGICLVCESL